MNHAYTTRDLDLQEHFTFKLKRVAAGTRVTITGVAHVPGNLLFVANAEICDSIPLEFLTLEKKSLCDTE